RCRINRRGGSFNGQRTFGVLPEIRSGLGDFLDRRWPSAAKLGSERPRRRIGLGVELAFEQRDEVLVVLERLGLASSGGERTDDGARGVLAHVVERKGALAGFRGVLRTAGGQLMLAEPHHGAEGKLREPLALGGQPFAPALLGDRNVVDEGA